MKSDNDIKILRYIFNFFLNIIFNNIVMPKAITKAKTKTIIDIILAYNKNLVIFSIKLF